MNIDFLNALFEYKFLQSAFFAGILAAVACGLTGSWIVVRRISFVAGGIAHSSLGGIGAAVFFGFYPMLGALIAAIIASVIMGLISMYWHEREDTLISAVWALGMAVGVLFLWATPGYQTGLDAYLFGNILLVTQTDLILMLVLDVLLITVFLLFYHQFQLTIFDEEFARIRGVPARLYYLVMLLLVAFAVVLLIKVVGMFLVIALLTLPAASAARHTKTLKSMMLMAVLLAIVITIAGLILSYELNLPSGAVMTLLAACFYLLSIGAEKLLFNR